MAKRSFVRRVQRAAVAACGVLAFLSSQVAALASPGATGSLNLSSIHRTVAAPNTLTSPVTITDGGKAMSINAGQMITPAQAVALQQVLATGTQSIILGLHGNAVGGSMTLASQQALTSLLVPHNVTVVTNFSTPSTLTLSGSVTNSGNLYAVSTNSSLADAIISASYITN